MSAGLNPYIDFKQSGIRWLGKIPIHWELKRPKQLFRKMSRPVRDCDEVVTCFRDGVVTLRKNRRLLGFTESLKEIGYQGVRKGDLVIHGMDAFAGSIGVSDSDGKATPVYSVCAPTSTHVNSNYYGHCVREMARAGWITALARGIRERSSDFRFEVFGAQVVPYPPPSEQTSIARFLNHATSRIDRYIRAKEQLIALLEEYKHALIHQAVTGRIDVRTSEPYPEYKESGVDWLGRIPKQWRVPRLRLLVDINTGGRDTINRVDDGKYPFFVRSQTVEKIDSWSFDGEAVLTAGDGVGVGKVFHYVNEKFDYHQRVYKLSGFREILGKFFFHYFKTTLRHEVLQGTAKSTVDSLRLPMLQNFPVALPPRHEQKQIIRYLEHAPSSVDAAIVGIKSSIELLQEYRARMIADVVTGKLDVREAAADVSEFNSLEEDVAGDVSNQINALELDEATARA